MTTTPQQTVAPSAPIPISPITGSERSLAPDMARGLMLLFIAIANVGTYLFGRASDDYGHITGSSFDQAALFLEHLFIADRTRPMFAILYGFGIAVMASRMLDRGMNAKGARKVLRRRSWWLVALGFAHSCLLFNGDILAMYGATGLIALFLVHLSARGLRRWLWGSALYVALVVVPLLGFLAISMGDDGESMFPNLPAYFEQLATGAIASVWNILGAVLMLFHVPLVVIGIMIQRAGWIDRPERHLGSLRRVFYSGMAVNLASSLPIALIALGAWHPAPWVYAIAIAATMIGGMYAGLGYICGFALLAHRLRSRSGSGIPRMLTAVGERSLTCYLLQSVIMAPLLSPWGFGLGEHLGYLSAFLIAMGAWAVTACIALLMDRAGRRGPFEVMLRGLTYGHGRRRPTASA